MGLTIKVTDPTGKAQGHKGGLNFNQGTAVAFAALNEGQIAGFERWGYTIEGVDEDGKKAVAEHAKAIDAKADGDKALKAQTAQAAMEARTVFNVTGGHPEAVPAKQGGK